MTSKAAICIALLQGRIISIRTGFMELAATNLPREIGRAIERESEGGFGVIISRVHRKGKSKFGVPCSWTEYRLNPTIEANKIGIEKMKAYVQSQLSSAPPPKTDKEVKEVKKIKSLTATNGQQSFL